MNSLKPSNNNDQAPYLLNNLKFLGNGFRLSGDN